MSNNVVETLKAARGNQDTVARLREGSLNKQIADISEALASPEFPLGPAELVGAYGTIKTVVGRKGPVTFRAYVEEREGQLVIGENIETFDVALPVSDMAADVLQVAKAAVEHVLDGDYEKATSQFEEISRSLDVRGDLSRKLRVAVNRQAIAVTAPWYAPVVEDQYQGEAVEVVVLDPEATDETERFRLACEELQTLIQDGLSETSAAFKSAEDVELPPEHALMAHDIIRDARRAVRCLEDADKSNYDEMASVFETVQARAGSLLKGLRFLAQIVEGTETEVSNTPDGERN